MNRLQKNVIHYIILFLIPCGLGYLAFSFLPMLSALYLSFTDWDIIGGSPDWIGFKNYVQIFTTDEFPRVMWNTTKFMLLYIPGIMLASLFVALLFNTKVKGVSGFRVVLFIPVLTSWVAGALIWRSALNGSYGLINNLLSIVGITGPGWLTDPSWSMVSVVLASLWKDIGFFSLIIFGGLRGIDESLFEAAEIDGANKLQIIWRIALPLITPVLFFVLIITMLNSFQIFTQVMVMTNGGPLGSTQVMAERIYNYGFRYFKMGYAAALSIVFLGIIVIVTVIQIILQKKWVYYG